VELEIMKLKFTLQAEDTIKLPERPGSTFRGAFGHGLREVACNLGDEVCKHCDLNTSCAYSLLFNPFLVGKERERTSNRFNNKPRPFVFEPLSEGKEIFKPGEKIEFRLNLFGYTKKFILYIIKAWRLLQKKGIGTGRGKFTLLEVWNSNDISGDKKRLYSADFGFDKEAVVTIDKQDLNQVKEIINKKELHLNLTAPMLLKYNGEEADIIQFNILIQNLFRRLSALSAFYGEEKLDIDFENYLERAKEVELVKNETSWQRWKRYSNRQNRRIKMKGLQGSVKYKGEITNFLLYLILGQYVHVGKNTVFGLGNYKIKRFK
jgi:hypothetical protein